MKTTITKIKVISAFFAILLISAIFPPLARAESHVGYNVNSNGTVYYIPPYRGGAMPVDYKPTIRAYPSAAVFLSYGFNSWGSVVPASEEDLSGPTGPLMEYADGTLVNDHGTVYVISEAGRYGIPSAAVFTERGYQWDSVINGDTSYIPNKGIIPAGAHLAGTLVNQDGTIYYISSLGKEGFPSMSVFNSWGFRLNQVVPANDKDRSMESNMHGSEVSPWSPGALTPTNSPMVY